MEERLENENFENFLTSNLPIRALESVSTVKEPVSHLS